MTPEDAALLKEAESWRRGRPCRDPEVILSALAQSLRAALTREAEMQKALRSIAENQCQCCAGDCGCGGKHEQTAKDTLAALQVDLKQE